jgi:hypothetical protein
VRVAGELAHWRDRVAAVSSSIDRVKLQGTGELSGRLRYGDGDAVKLDDAKLFVQQLPLPGLRPDRGGTDALGQHHVNYLAESSRLELGSTAVRCPTLTGTSTRLSLVLGDRVRVGGKLHVEAKPRAGREVVRPGGDGQRPARAFLGRRRRRRVGRAP